MLVKLAEALRLMTASHQLDVIVRASNCDTQEVGAGDPKFKVILVPIGGQVLKTNKQTDKHHPLQEIT